MSDQICSPVQTYIPRDTLRRYCRRFPRSQPMLDRAAGDLSRVSDTRAMPLPMQGHESPPALQVLWQYDCDTAFSPRCLSKLFNHRNTQQSSSRQGLPVRQCSQCPNWNKIQLCSHRQGKSTLLPPRNTYYLNNTSCC